MNSSAYIAVITGEDRPTSGSKVTAPCTSLERDFTVGRRTVHFPIITPKKEVCVGIYNSIAEAQAAIEKNRADRLAAAVAKNDMSVDEFIAYRDKLQSPASYRMIDVNHCGPNDAAFVKDHVRRSTGWMSYVGDKVSNYSLAMSNYSLTMSKLSSFFCASLSCNQYV